MADIEIKVAKDQENKLLQRREILVTASYSGKTPTREEIKEETCKKLSLNPDLTLIIKIHQQYGSTNADVFVHSFKSKEAKEKAESPKVKKKVPVEKKAGAEATIKQKK